MHPSPLSSDPLFHREKMLRAVADATQRLLSNPDTDEAIRECVAILGAGLEADQAYFLDVVYPDPSSPPFPPSSPPFLAPSPSSAYHAPLPPSSPASPLLIYHNYEWYLDGRPPLYRDPNLQGIPGEYHPLAQTAILAGRAFQSFVDDLDDQLPIKALMLAQNVQSFIFFPITIAQRVEAVLGFDDIHRKRTWDDAQLSLLQSVANSIAITIQRQREIHDLRKTREILQNTNQLARVGGWEVDLIQHRAFWTPITKEIHEIPLDHQPDLDASIAFYQDGEPRQRVQQAVQQAIQQGSPFTFEEPLITAQGRTIWGRAIGKPEFREGQCVRLYGAFQDVTAYHQAQDSLRRSEAKFRNLFALAPVGIALHDSHTGLFLEANRAFLDLLGYLPDEIQSLSYRHLLPPEDADSFLALLSEDRPSSSSCASTQTLLRKDRSKATVLIRYLKASDTPASSVVWTIIEDLSPRLALEEQVRHAQKMEALGRLVGGIAHDSNNMLSVILANAEMLLDEDGLSPFLLESLEAIRDAASRSAALIQKLLSFARKQPSQPRIVDIHDSITQAFQILRRFFSEDIHFSCELEAEDAKISIDPTQIEQVLANLCVNARDALSPHGSVFLRTSNLRFHRFNPAKHPKDLPPGNYLQITCQDTGSGIEPHILPHIFEPFFSTKDVGKGTGLGLSTTYGIVKQHNGHIFVESLPGKGTSFHLFFPLASSSPLASADPGTSQPLPLLPHLPPSPHHETILFVEDEPAVLRIGVRLLTKLGYRVLSASSPSEALRLASEPIDLLITDLIMPGMTGRELAFTLRKARPFLRVLYLSGYAPDVLSPEGLFEEGASFLQKPFSSRNLAELLHRLFTSPPLPAPSGSFDSVPSSGSFDQAP